MHTCSICQSECHVTEQSVEKGILVYCETCQITRHGCCCCEKSYSTKGNVTRHLESNPHNLDDGNGHYKQCCTWTNVDSMINQQATVFLPVGLGEEIEISTQPYQISNTLITNQEQWTDTRLYLIYHAFDTPPFKYESLPNWNARANNITVLPKVEEFIDSLDPFKSNFEYAVFQLTNEFTNRQYETIRLLDKLRQCDLPMNYDYSMTNEKILTEDLSDIKTDYISSSTFYRRLSLMDTKNTTYTWNDLSFKYHSLQDGLARLFSSLENCKNIFLTPQPSNIKTEYYHSDHFKKLYDTNNKLPLLVLGLYVDDFPLSDRLTVAGKNIGFYVQNIPLSILRKLDDGYLLWSLLSKEISKDVWLPVLLKDVETVHTIKVFHAGLEKFIVVRVLIEFVHGDTIELNDLAYMIACTGNNSCCFKCNKMKERCFLINEQTTERSLNHRFGLVRGLWINITNLSEEEQLEAIKSFQTDYGYTFHIRIPWQTIGLDIYKKGTIDVLHVQFTGTGCSKVIIRYIISLCTISQQNRIRNRILDLFHLDLDRDTSFHAQQWEQIIRGSILIFKDIVPINFFKIITNRVLFVSLLKCQCIDDNYINILQKAFIECRTYELEILTSDFINTPNFHREEELVKQIRNLQIPAVFTECGVGEKMNKTCKEPFCKKFSIDWAFEELTRQRYIIRQITRNYYSKEDPFISKHNGSERYYYTKGDPITTIYNNTFNLGINDFVQKFQSEVVIGKIVKFIQRPNRLVVVVNKTSVSPFIAQCQQVTETNNEEQWIFNDLVPAFVGKMEGKLYYSPYL